VEAHAETALLMAGGSRMGHRLEEPTDVRVVHRLDRAMWGSFVEELEGGNVFHTPKMFDAFARTEGYRPSVWAAVDGSSRPLALFVPVEVSLMGGPLRYLTTRSVAFGSVLAAPGQRGRDALSMLLHTYGREVSRRVVFTELRNLVDMGELRPIIGEAGFEFRDHLNFLIDLRRPLEDIWGDIRPNARRNIRKAMRADVVVRQAESSSDIAAAYGILRDAYKLIRVPLPPSTLFHSAFELLGALGMMKVLLAEAEGVMIGALMLLLYKDVVVYWYTATLRDYSALRPADLLVWRSLELGQQSGYRTFDFGGGGSPETRYGVRDFKAKFGGDLVNFGRHTIIHSPARFKLAQAGYRVRRRFL
jgi:serine/alanine adding enzyme